MTTRVPNTLSLCPAGSSVNAPVDFSKAVENQYVGLVLPRLTADHLNSSPHIVSKYQQNLGCLQQPREEIFQRSWIDNA